MMKSAILLMVSCVFMFLVVSYIQDVEGANKRCHLNQMFTGKCGNDGNKACLGDFKNKRFRYDLCQCTDATQISPSLPPQRVCNCSRPC
ncbi:putative defensin-like protein 228 [Arabidopsis thaliana]|uniref:Putative defensin-like protein 228 n=2 Tax=Arabidopsis thaliana TaxID=3702 RepID=DF228_ARATH|nr:SCR-like 3 [Arabidopsis thaliana]P82622.2 RecName: Full=Putative defensin-like protein 228; AltName: Full=Putative S locus cysteine-rich-like protein 3; Short=Protein SCRL3; Short=SCR-like protein 3; Flags: Precursor [Arabidopsis thaliana]AEE28335.1 SCR-like 3 [Arabidopsis thaliana]CAA0180278.1 unnamed protein product [Arabidopsis thaliana]VYS45442.1 unnamed protein product [Arabidopsis thaliana]|eukprot:NP_001031003.1 SCR-like 3 [Arabidopsis thaliana]